MEMIAEREIEKQEQVSTGILVVILANGRLQMIDSVEFSEYQQCKWENRTLWLGEQMHCLHERAVFIKWIDEEALVYGY